MKNAYLVFLSFLLFQLNVYSQDNQITVSGVITDAKSGMPIPGATVVEKGTTNGTVTNFDGEFEMEVLSNGILQISYLGYTTQEIEVAGKTQFSIDLEPSSAALDEVVVVAYGEQKEITVVGSVSTIDPEELRVPTANLTNALAGRLSGVIAVQRRGTPGSNGSSFFIRGVSTFSGAQNPLILLDGVAISSGDLNALAPEVIESVSVLKDATATAVYGSRGANGVLIVTTRTGKDLDEAKIYARVQSQISLPTSIPDFVGGVEYMELFNEAVTQRGTGEILYTQDQIEGTRKGLDKYVYPNINWYDELFNDYTFNQEANVNIQGGGKKVGYFMSATLNRSTGLLKNFDLNSYDSNIKVNRFAFQNNIDAELSPTTKLALKLNTQLRYFNGPSNSAASLFGSVMNANPVDFPKYFPSDSISDPSKILYGGKSGGRVNGGWANPFALLTRGYTDNFQSTVLATLNGEQELDFILEGLTFKALVSFKNWSSTTVTRSRGYNQYQINSYEKLPDGSYDYDLNMIGTPQDLTLGTETETTGDRKLYIQPSLFYQNTFGDHTVSGLLVYNQTEYNINAPEDLLSSLPHRTMGFAGRATYDYKDTYLVEANFGYNGSENFAEGHRFGFFPSFGAGYVISNEDYFSDFTDVINLLKIRASWGLVGNASIGGARFPYLSNIDLDGRGYTTGRDQNITYKGPTYLQFANRDITWEVAEKMNLGVEIGLFNQLTLNVDLWRESRTDIFVDLSSTIPTIFGTAGTNVYSNVGEVLNHGIDVSLSYFKRFNEDLQISSRGTFTFAQNEIIVNNEPAFTQFPNLSAVGHPIGQPLGYVAERLFIDQAEIDNSPVQQLGSIPAPGDIKYKDITGDGIINSDDRVRMGYPELPEIIYGLSTTVQYKQFDFSFLLQGVARTSFFINGFHPFGTQGVRGVMQFIADDHYSDANPDIYAPYPKLSKADNKNNTENSTYWLRNGAFLKLRSAEIGYTTGLARFFINGYNLWTFSEFDLWDPEQGGGNGLVYPTQTVINVGVQLRFN